MMNPEPNPSNAGPKGGEFTMVEIAVNHKAPYPTTCGFRQQKETGEPKGNHWENI